MAEAFADLPESPDLNLPAGQEDAGQVAPDHGADVSLPEKTMHTPEKEASDRGTTTGGIISPAGSSVRKAPADLMALALEAGYSNGVPRGARGEGPPFAPAGWSWRVGSKARINNKGWYADSFRKHPQAQELGSKPAVERFLRDKLLVPKENIEAIQSSYEWHIPASTEIRKDIEDVRASTAKRNSSGDGSPATASKRKRIPVNKDAEDWRTPSPATKKVDLTEPASTDAADEKPVSLDEILATPGNWPELAKRLRRIVRANPGYLDNLEEEAKGRDLGQLRAQLLTSADDVAAVQMDTLPHSLVSLIALVATAGRVDDIQKKRRKISELATITREEVQPGGTGGSVVIEEEARPKRKRKSTLGSPDGTAKASKSNADGGKGTPVAEAGAGPTRTRKGIEDAAANSQDAVLSMRTLLELKPTLSALSVSVDVEEPTDEEVDQAWRAVGDVLLTPPTEGTSEAQIAAPGTPTGPEQAAAASLVLGNGAAAASSSQAAALIAAPATKQDREIYEYKLKLAKLERIKGEWVQAFEEKLAQYRGHKEALEQLVAKRRAEQDAQRRKIGEEEAKLVVAHTTAISDIQALEALIDLPDVVAAELAKPKLPWETSFGKKVQEARETRAAMWQEKWKELNDVRKANLEQLKRKVEVYVKLNKEIPEEQIQAERERSNKEWEELSGFLNEEKAEMERGLARINELEAAARSAFIAYKTQLTRVDKERSKLQAMLKEGVE